MDRLFSNAFSLHRLLVRRDSRNNLLKLIAVFLRKTWDGPSNPTRKAAL